MTPSPILRSEIDQLIREPLTMGDRKPVLGFTIDSETSKDLDDAIWIEPNQTGVVISVHIADVTELVPIKSQLEQRAFSQVETRYLASHNKPMFPRELSEDKLSLLEDQPRWTLTIRITLDESANIKQTQLLSTHLTSIKRFSYATADHTLHDPSQPLFQVLRYCELWAQKLAWKRQKAGAFGQSTIGGVTLDEEGKLIESPRYHSQQIIQEFMVLANTAVASLAEEHQLPILYRNHTASAIAPESKILIETLTTLGLPELVRQKLQSWLNPAAYSPAVIGHFALCLPAYTHFTSPIRRVADYVNHRILKAVFIEEKQSPYSVEELEAIAKHINEKKQEVKEKRNEHFREQRLVKTVNVLNKKETIPSLSEKEFSQILKDSLKVSKLDKLVPEAKQRLENRTLKPSDLYYLVFGDYQNPDNRTLIKDELLNYLEAQPALATQILQIASSIGQTTVDYIEKTTPSGQFGFWTVFEGQTTTKPSIAGNKQTAKHQSNRYWLQGKLENTLHDPTQIDETALEDYWTEETIIMTSSVVIEEELDLSTVPQEAINSPIAHLHTTLQRLNLKKPAYVYQRMANQWHCCCQVQWLDEILIETEALGQTKKEGKAQASLKAIIELENYVIEDLEDV
ncbi:ribonuclease II-like protein [Crocosphaera subtropica ATCC 51142]|uniref:Ribonuclease II-like protein n=1 Tax=Crocosphaera subtropica (strain ATCC 51142 / BH68) TaxID=43989 RepID=B1WXG4_CROS5|nr:ribonuclease catalytic domain-containing protein [Crocosphaera subtropica]ACB52505.1 ribonuclease II-like protein [Crocosphaera subtropica ATCC 51142]